MRRRESVAALAAAVVWPSAALSQVGRRFIVLVHPSAAVSEMSENGSAGYQVLLGELRRRGYVEGDRLIVARRSGEGRADQYADLARDVVSLQPDLIYSNSRRLVQHLRSATSTIPIVAMTSDPVAAGLAESLARPGGNVTGVSTEVSLEVLGKSIEILKEMVPALTRLAVLTPASSWEGARRAEVSRIGHRFGIEVAGAVLNPPIGQGEYQRVFAALQVEPGSGLLVGQQQENVTHRRVIVGLAERHRVPAVYPYRSFIQDGGLISHGVVESERWRLAGEYIARILDGAHPRDLPFQLPTKHELLINAPVARALGLTLSPSLLARADEVIE